MDTTLHRKESIIYTTIDVISEYGIQSVSTREIARRAGISEGTIFKHFKTKTDLLMAVLNHYSQYDDDISATTKAKYKYKNFRSAISFYVNSYMEYYENYPAIVSIMQSYDVLTADKNLGEKVRSIFQSRIEFIEELISEGQRQGEIKKDLRPELLSLIITGSIRTICLKWRLNGYDFSLKEVNIDALNTILDAFCRA